MSNFDWEAFAKGEVQVTAAPSDVIDAAEKVQTWLRVHLPGGDVLGLGELSKQPRGLRAVAHTLDELPDPHEIVVIVMPKQIIKNRDTKKSFSVPEILHAQIKRFRDGKLRLRTPEGLEGEILPQTEPFIRWVKLDDFDVLSKSEMKAAVRAIRQAEIDDFDTD